MSNLSLVYDADDYIKARVRVLYTTGGSIVVYDMTNETEAEISIQGISGGYSTISGDEYDVEVLKNSYFSLKT